MRGRGPGRGRLWRRDGSWVFDYRAEDGKRRREVLGSTKREAEALAADLVAQRNRRLRGLEPEARDIQLTELAAVYLGDLAGRSGAHHLKNVTAELNQIIEALPATKVSDLRPVDVVQYRARLLEEGHSPRWANVVICSLQSALRWAVRLELINRSPIDAVRKLPEGPRVHRYKRRALSEPEIAALLAAVEAEDEEMRGPKRVPQAAFFNVLIETGLRYGEARQLRWADVDRENCALVVRSETAKGGRERPVPIRAELMTEILSLRASHWKARKLPPLDGDSVFVAPRGNPWPVYSNNVRRLLDRLLERAGIERQDANGRRIDVHALRHTAATRLARNGVALGTTQKILGHSSPVLTARHYVHLDLEDMRSAVESAGPAGRGKDLKSGRTEAV